MPSVTTDDILAAIRQAQAESPAEEGFTTGELADQLGVIPFTARQRIHKLLKAGTIEPVKLRRKYIDGRVASVPGYRLTGP